MVPGQDEVAGSTPISAGGCTAGEPGVRSTGDFCAPMNSRAFRLAPLRSARLGRAVHDGDAGPRAQAGQLGAVLHDAGLLRLGRQHRQGRRLSDHTVLDLLQHECGVAGDQFVQVEWHGDR